ncbi:hypothetical protein BCV69DRAFT_284175 [Microstroma glucosiphilum]|uniref:DUF7137 domain-containing protein n=1 Tax=Pseudomicrostroma glucosiphilum TaxID=1684307 RepID=A0A316U977_9BASI|nr:hypothetical protein BCV69DRAFT_284175 [Pseudomicrostroma glucosiphilum]PWN19545.1 hypothetical protein BCV69DRAFT_284175 [Pseudomicrostroma glucosiphilum]
MASPRSHARTVYAPQSSRTFLTLVLQLLIVLLAYCTSAVTAQVNSVTQSATVAASTTTSSVSIASTAAAGGLTVTLPNETADASYYKIAPAVNVTFAWNFTSVLSYGTSLTIQAYCTSNSNTYTITSLPATATQVIWNPYSYSVSAVARGSAALVQETYRLQIFDERGLDAASSPGLMSPNEDTDFALYIPQSYTALADGWTCTGCKSGASGLHASPLLLGVVTVLLTTFLSGWSICTRA